MFGPLNGNRRSIKFALLVVEEKGTILGGVWAGGGRVEGK